MNETGPDKSDERAPRKREKRDVHGWLVLDKPVGMTSTHAVSVVKRAFQAKRAGHAGTLDPLASGCLPIALGEATKTVPFVMDGRKTYRFTVRWGEETRHRRRRRPRRRRQARRGPTAAEIRALLPRFTGTIVQVPPRFSAVKIEGERAYDLAREGEVVELEARPVEIHRLELVETPDADHAVFEPPNAAKAPMCARSRATWAALLGCFGHVVALRRTAVGPFAEDDRGRRSTRCRSEPGKRRRPARLPVRRCLPVAAGLAALPALAVSRADAGAARPRPAGAAARPRCALDRQGWVAVSTQGALIALAEVETGRAASAANLQFGQRR